ncbi:MAG: hypothetical protein ACR2KF_03215 [Nitrososphaeraceae archaeon]
MGCLGSISPPVYEALFCLAIITSTDMDKGAKLYMSNKFADPIPISEEVMILLIGK